MALSPQLKLSSNQSAARMKSDISEVAADGYSKNEMFSTGDVPSATASRNAERISGLSSHKSAILDKSRASILSDKVSGLFRGLCYLIWNFRK